MTGPAKRAHSHSIRLQHVGVTPVEGLFLEGGFEGEFGSRSRADRQGRYRGQCRQAGHLYDSHAGNDIRSAVAHP